MYGAQIPPNFYPPHHGGGINPGFMSTPKPVGVFWDIENCPVSKGILASAVVHSIRNSFIVNRLNHREFEFLVACDITKLRKDIAVDMNKAGGVILAHVSSESKNAADEKLRESMKRFVDTHAALAPMLVLISGDIDFVNDLRAYQTRQGCNIVVLHGATASPHFKQGWNEVYAFKDFLARIPQEPSSKSPEEPNKNMPIQHGGGHSPPGPHGQDFNGFRQPLPNAGPRNFTPPLFPPNRNAGPGNFAPAHASNQHQNTRPREFAPLPSNQHQNTGPRQFAPPPSNQHQNTGPRHFAPLPGNQHLPNGPRHCTSPPPPPLHQQNSGPRNFNPPPPNQHQPAGPRNFVPPNSQPQFNPRNAARFPGVSIPQPQGQQSTASMPMNGEPQLSKRAKKRAQKFGSNSNLAESQQNTNLGGGPGARQQHAEGQNQPQKQKQKFGSTSNLTQVPHTNMGAGSADAQQQNFENQNKPRQKHTSGQSQTHGENNGQGGAHKAKKNRSKNKNGNAGQEKSTEQNKDKSGGGAGNSGGPRPHIILMVSGLPGKMDFRILKNHLQDYASSVSGKVMYVNNGQAFITFKEQSDADKAIELFNGREVYGKKLTIQLSKTIPFQNPKPGMGAGDQVGEGNSNGDGATGFVMVDHNLPQPPPEFKAPVTTGSAVGHRHEIFGVPSSTPSASDTFAPEILAFATAAMNELSLSLNKEQDGAVAAGSGKKEKKGKTKDPNCVIQ